MADNEFECPVPDEACEDEVAAKPELLRCIYSQLAKINGEINRMEPKKIKSKLVKYNLCVDGNIEVQRKRLKHFYRKVKLASANVYINQELLPYYVVLDFEATCEANNTPNYKHEIIEFPGVLINTRTLKIVDTFRKICRPTIKTRLSEFCQDLTGITQHDIDKADTFPVVFQQFLEWMEKHELGTKHNFAIVTDGSWDTCRFLYVQCLLSNLSYPDWAKKWVNIRKVFANFYKFGKPNLSSMLEYLGMGFEGRKHCGLDDAKNIARIQIRLMCDGANVQVNEMLTPHCLKTQLDLATGGSCEDLESILTNLHLEGEKSPVKTPDKGKLSTFKDIKKERYKMEAKLALSLRDENSTNETSLIEDEEEDKMGHFHSSSRRLTTKTTVKKKKKARKLCH